MESKVAELDEPPNISEDGIKGWWLENVVRPQRDRERTTSPVGTSFFFFYGSHMDPEILQIVIDLPEQPVFEDAWVEGYRLRKWGIYPAVVPKRGSKVYGRMWRTENREHAERLARYETAPYTCEPCDIKSFDREGSVPGYIFTWSDVGGQMGLYDGVFDLDWYQTYLKPGLLRSWRAKLKAEKEVKT